MPLSPGDQVDLGGWRVRALGTRHPVDSQGYVLIRLHKRLRADLVGAPRERILAVKSSGAGALRGRAR